jgi:type II secretory pathway pseudopilin PulG
MTDSKLSRNSGRRRAQRGVSLLEILVVLVLLVLGILIIVRLFPSGFFSIESAGNAALADGLGSAALGAQTQDLGSLPDAILPGKMDNFGQPSSTAGDAAYSPDDPNLLDNARVVNNETITVPSASTGRSVYAVKYGPISLGVDPAVGTDPATSTILTMLPPYLTINGLDWAPLDGNPSSEPASPLGPQDTLTNSSARSFLFDLKNQKIAVPFAPYTLTDKTTTPPTYTSYDQRMVVTIYGSDHLNYTEYIDVPPGTTRNGASQFAPKDSNNPQGYLPDTATNYQGGWFDPTKAYPDANISSPQAVLPTGVTWLRVTLYRPFTGIANNKTSGYDPNLFGLDPYQFQFVSANLNGTVPGVNVGAIAFNPIAAHGSGTDAIKAQISYVTSTWGILHEDRDIPALNGSDTSAVRLTLKNLKRAGDPNPDNTIYGGIAGAGSGIVVQNLDTGAVIAPAATTAPTYDPTDPAAPLYDEDLNGTSTDPTRINVSYATGRLTFGAGVFGDNKAHRVRIFYQGDANWTVAVQKAPAYFAQVAPTAAAPGATPLAADQFALDAPNALVYFARCNAGKTVELDGTYTSGGTTQAFSDTVAVDPTLNAAGDVDVRVNLNDATKSGTAVPPGAVVTFSAVRGLSSRAVVAWKERNQWKVHTVDTILTRPQP